MTKNRIPTLRQQHVLATLTRLRDKLGYPPTIRELARVLGISPAGVVGHLKTLERLGAIRREEGTARGIQILEG